VDANDLDMFSAPAGDDDYMGMESRMNGGSEFDQNPDF
jgi:hypothetical protein